MPPVGAAAPIYRAIYQSSGLPGGPPRIQPVANADPRLGGGLGATQSGRPATVFVPHQTAQNLNPSLTGIPAFNGTPAGQAGGGVGVMLHEFAHTQQPLVYNNLVREGGAQAFARLNEQRVAQSLGIPFSPAPQSSHDADARFVTQRYGIPWVANGQFNRPSTHVAALALLSALSHGGFGG